jgi:hypothetical protein
MNPLAEPAGEMSRDMTRRGFTGTLAVAGVAVPALAGLTGRPAPVTAPRGRMILQLTAALAVFPIEFPGAGENQHGAARVTVPRLRAAAGRLTARRLSLVNAGADELIGDGLLGQNQAQLLRAIGRRACTGDQAPLTAVAALAAATVSGRIDPGSDSFALLWTGTLRRLQQRGLLAGVVAARGLA